MSAIQIKGVNDYLLFMMNDEVSDEANLSALENLLSSPSFQKKDFYVKGYFDYGVKIFTKERFDSLMDVLKRTQCVLFCGLNKQTQIEKKLIHKAGIIRNGEVLYCEDDLLFEGRVNPGGHLVCTGKVFVLGKCFGKIEANGKGATINASDLNHASIQINDKRIEDISVDTLTTFYEENNTIRCSREDEKIWQEQL